MQKFLQYELTVATKDRPKAFRVITLLLFSFSITVIVVSSLVHVLSSEQRKQVYDQVKELKYVGFAGAPASRMLHIKK